MNINNNFSMLFEVAFSMFFKRLMYNKILRENEFEKQRHTN